jgi:putative membrane protein
MKTEAYTNQDKTVFKWVIAISVLVFTAVLVLNRKILPRPSPVPSFVYLLPAINATINAICTLLLLASLYFIKQKNILVHKKLNLITFALSAAFFICYITYHYMADETRYPIDAPYRSLYLTILASHIILAALVLPMILVSFYLGLTSKVTLHKKWVRFTFPIWLYVTITGVVIYLMISPYYKH